MPDFKPKPRNAPWLTPNLTLSNPDKTLKAYTEAFGFEVDVKSEKSGLPEHLEITHGGKPIAMGGAEEFETGYGVGKSPATMGVAAPQAFYVYVDDVDAHHAGLSKKRSVTIKEKPTDRYWGDRAYTVTCPSGYTWMFASVLADPPNRPD